MPDSNVEPPRSFARGAPTRCGILFIAAVNHLSLLTIRLTTIVPDRHSTTLDPHSPAGPQPSAAAPSPLAPQASPRSSTHLTSAPPASARPPRPWLDAAIFLIIWLPAAAMALYVK